MKFIGVHPRCLRCVLTLVFTFMGCSLVTRTTLAGKPPSASAAAQKNALEVLELAIVSLQQSKSETEEATVTRLVLEAKVLKVERTATQLKVGATITIEYDHRQPKHSGGVDPNKMPMLRVGDICPAYLIQKTDKPLIYQPAAGGHTFNRVQS